MKVDGNSTGFRTKLNVEQISHLRFDMYVFGFNDVRPNLFYDSFVDYV